MNRKKNQPEEGILIVFEGIDGSGKSTQAERSFARLRGLGLPVCIFSEPTKGLYGKTIRGLLCGEIPRRSPSEELDLFIRDRQEDVANNIQPALGRGEIVLLDRYYYSTMAYQGAMGIDIEEIRVKNECFAPVPDLAFIFLVSVDKGLARIRANRSGGGDHYEKDIFLKQVDKIYRSLKDPQIKHINSDRPLPEVTQEVDQIIDLFLAKKGWRY